MKNGKNIHSQKCLVVVLCSNTSGADSCVVMSCG